MLSTWNQHRSCDLTDHWQSLLINLAEWEAKISYRQNKAYHWSLWGWTLHLEETVPPAGSNAKNICGVSRWEFSTLAWALGWPMLCLAITFCCLHWLPFYFQSWTCHTLKLLLNVPGIRSKLDQLKLSSHTWTAGWLLHVVIFLFGSIFHIITGLSIPINTRSTILKRV